MQNILSRGSDKYDVRQTEKYGRGVFCTKKILKGEVIRIFTGKRISEIACDKMIADGVLNNDDPFQIQHSEYILLDDISICFNHSCEPNSGFCGEATLFALKDIEPGEEITYDYSTTVDPNNFTFTTMVNCLCGKPRCRRKLGNVSSIPTAILDYYRREGALQDYIIFELNKL